MIDQSNEGEAPGPTADEMSVLKSRARMMGLQFSNNIGIEALRLKLNAKLEQEDSSEKALEVSEALVAQVVYATAGVMAPNPLAGEISPQPERRLTLREYLIKDEMRLVRVRITNMDPKKKDLPGEIITVANDYLGTVRKFVPFGEVTDDGFHLPWCLYQVLLERKFQDVRTRRDAKGQMIVTQKWVREFAMEVLPDLTTEELHNLANAQAAAGIFETVEA